MHHAIRTRDRQIQSDGVAVERGVARARDGVNELALDGSLARSVTSRASVMIQALPAVDAEFVYYLLGERLCDESGVLLPEQYSLVRDRL